MGTNISHPNCCSVPRAERAEIIANDQGHRITPSWVSFTSDERLSVTTPSFFLFIYFTMYRVGDNAKNAFHFNPMNTVFDAKRLIGRTFNDSDVQRDIKHWPFTVRDIAGKPSVQIRYHGELKDFVCQLYIYCTRVF